MAEEKEAEAIEAIKKKERKKGCLIGCLVSILIAVLLVVAFFVVSFLFYRSKGPTLMFGAMEQLILQSLGPDYTQEEKEEIRRAFDDFIEARRKAGVPTEELTAEGEKMYSEVRYYLGDGKLTRDEVDSILEYLRGATE